VCLLIGFNSICGNVVIAVTNYKFEKFIKSKNLAQKTSVLNSNKPLSIPLNVKRGVQMIILQYAP